MLTPDEESAVYQSIEGVTTLATQGLAQQTDVSGVIHFVANLHRAIGQVTDKSISRGATLACQAGCFYCCSVRVEVTEPEVFRIVRWLKSQSPQLLTQVTQALQARLHDGPSEPVSSPPERRYCAFLANGLCSIYEVRPAVCRKGHSLSASACESFAPTIPQNLQLLLESEALIAGTSAAYQAHRLSSVPQELQRAVLAALEDPSLEAHWYQDRHP